MRTLQQMFLAVLAMTPWTAVLIGLLLALRQWKNQQLSARFFQLAFVVLALRLALPVDLSLPAAPVRVELPTQQAVIAADPQPEPLERHPPIQEDSPKPPQEAEAVRRADGLDLSLMLAGLWFSGAAGFFLFRLTSYLCFCRKVTASRRSAPEKLCQQAERAFGRPVPVYLVPQLPGPILMGLMRPAVYLPQQTDPEALPYILAHEACHARRRDIPMQFLLLAAQSVHWFDPMVHWMACAARQDMERSCDAQVLQGRDLLYRQAYGRAVLQSLAAVCQHQALMLSTGFSSRKDVKRRFEEMFQMKEKKNGRVLLALLAVGVLAASLLVACGGAVDASRIEEVSQPPLRQEDESQSESAAQSDAAVSEQEAAASVSEEQPVQQAASQPPEEQLTFADSAALKWPVPEFRYVSRWKGSSHHGVDICAAAGADILACAEGSVTEAKKGDHLWGNYLVVDHGNGLETRYLHCAELLVKAGDPVTQGQKIATVGNTGASTGNHLHLEVYQDGELADPAQLLGVQTTGE